MQKEAQGDQHTNLLERKLRGRGALLLSLLWRLEETVLMWELVVFWGKF